MAASFILAKSRKLGNSLYSVKTGFEISQDCSGVNLQSNKRDKKRIWPEFDDNLNSTMGLKACVTTYNSDKITIF